MKKTDPRLVWAIALSGALMALWLVLVSALVWATLTLPERAAVGSVLGERVMLVFGAWLGGLAIVEFGDFRWMWYADIMLALLAAVLNLPIREAAVERRVATA